MIDQYKQLASDIVKYGKKLGADQVSTSLVNAVSFQVEVRDGKIESCLPPYGVDVFLLEFSSWVRNG